MTQRTSVSKRHRNIASLIVASTMYLYIHCTLWSRRAGNCCKQTGIERGERERGRERGREREGLHQYFELSFIKMRIISLWHKTGHFFTSLLPSKICQAKMYMVIVCNQSALIQFHQLSQNMLYIDLYEKKKVWYVLLREDTYCYERKKGCIKNPRTTRAPTTTNRTEPKKANTMSPASRP